MKSLENLRSEEKEALLKFPAYIALLAANRDGRLDEEEKRSAIRFSHIKTYSCHPLLSNFFKEADRVFEKNIEQLDNDLPKERHQRETAIQDELANLEKIVVKLGKEYTSVMHHSMQSFKNHVSKAHHNVLVDFIFPMPIKDISY
jgi:anaerobic ribonucleoside-triphosphate reductase